MSFDVEEIRKQFDEVIKYSQELEDINTKELFDKWLAAKRDFIESFGDKLIVELPEKVTFDLTEHEKQKRIGDFLTLVECTFDNAPLANFIDSQKEGFYRNEVLYEYNYEGKDIPKGMKLIKAFKYFEDDPKVLEKIQNAASMIIQEDKVSGYLCLSVHPLDFISASENCHNWHSCHALDGDYRAGNISYMVDKSTIMCYMRADKKDYILPNFPETVPWNSKKWRVWIYLSNNWDMMFVGRQYPFTSMTGLKFAKKQLIEPALNTLFSDFINNYYTDSLEIKRDGEYVSGSEIAQRSLIVNRHYVDLCLLVQEGEDSLAFNDILRSSSYNKPYYAYRVVKYTHWLLGDAYRKNLTLFDDNKFTIGKAFNCLKCGKQHVLYSHTFLCPDCYDEKEREED